MDQGILSYHNQLLDVEKSICEALYFAIQNELKNSNCKIWHSHPVWFIHDNPIVGYSKQKNGIRLMFWSGADFDESLLRVRGGKFKDASIFYQQVSDIQVDDLVRWLHKSTYIQWDYKNLVKRKGKLEKLVIAET